jgi:hypothetical protein
MRGSDMTTRGARSGALITLALATSLVAAVAPAASARPAVPAAVVTTSTPSAVVPLVGSSTLLVYAEITGPDASGGFTDAVMTRSRSGQVAQIGTVGGSAELVGDAPWSLVGNMLTADLSIRGRLVNWWNLASGLHGTVRIPRDHKPADWSYDGSTPDGLLVSLANFTHRWVYDEQPNGDVRKLGAAGIRDDLAVGPTGFMLSSSHTNPRVRFQRWSDPGVYRLVHQFHGDYTCADLAQRYIGCYLAPGQYASPDADLPVTRLAVLPLNGGPLRTTATCADGQIPKRGFGIDIDPIGMVAGQLVGAGCGALQFLSHTGQVTSPTWHSTFRWLTTITAYGEMVYVNDPPTVIKSISNATRRPKTLVSLSG